VPFPHTGSFTGGNRLSDVLTTYLSPAAPGDLLLDLGCGEGIMGFQLARERRYEYIGVDVAGEGPTALADAHALPFGDGTFAACCTFSVLEHVRVPRLATLELARVIRPGGTLIGTVAFLEPLHEGSYFHHTHYGLHDILSSAGFEDIRIEANADWRATDALFSMYTANGIPFGRFLRPLVSPLLRFLSRSTRRTTERHPEELRRMTGGYRFVARRPV
jgi:ubiquinone/menaquinone biosynthesis C-methylase UbiE